MFFVVLEALVGIVPALSALMVMAWVVQQRIGNSGRIWTCSVGLAGACGARWPLADTAPNAPQSLVAVFFPQNQGFGSIPLLFSIFVAARLRSRALPPRNGALR